MTASFCNWCGKPNTEAAHDLCQRRLALVDPPRFCAECARRMVVQVTPAGWVARCSRHGEISSAR